MLTKKMEAMDLDPKVKQELEAKLKAQEAEITRYSHFFL